MKNRQEVYAIGLILNNKQKPIALHNYDIKGELMEDINGVTIYDWTLNDFDWKK